jgi:hypothetical protein
MIVFLKGKSIETDLSPDESLHAVNGEDSHGISKSKSVETDLAPDESLRTVHSNGSDSVLPQVLGNLIRANFLSCLLLEFIQ